MSAEHTIEVTTYFDGRTLNDDDSDEVPRERPRQRRYV